jgi:FixJ family two-component response regulator
MATRMTILVVEDDASLRRAIGRLLTAAGYDEENFASAEELIGSEAAATASCLVTDIHLPGLSGFDLVDALRRRGAGLPVVFITAFDGADLRAKAGRLAGATYLAKPFEGHTLIGAVQSLTAIGRH